MKSLQSQIVNCAKTTWTNFMPKLFTVQDHFYIVQCPFVHVQKPLELTSMPFCTRAKPLELTSMPFCTRAKTPWSNFNTFLYTCKTVLQTFNALLFTMQNRPANVQCPFVHDAKPLCKRSRPFCSRCKSSWRNFRGRLFITQNRCANVQCAWYLNDLVRTSYWSKELFECKHCAFLFFWWRVIWFVLLFAVNSGLFCNVLLSNGYDRILFV